MTLTERWQLETLAEQFARGTLDPADLPRLESLARRDEAERNATESADQTRLLPASAAALWD